MTGKKLLTLFFVVLISLGIIGGCNNGNGNIILDGPVDDSEPVDDVDDSEPVGGSESTNALLFSTLSDLVDGFTSGASGALFGWMLSGGQSAGIPAINTDLMNIQMTLDQISMDLTAIENELEMLACEFDSVVIQSEAATAIDTWYNAYEQFLMDMQQGTSIPVSQLQDWANNVLNGEGATMSVTAAMSQLKDVGTEGAGTSGSIANCIVANSADNDLYLMSMIDDRPYYNTFVLPIQNWFLTYNTRAIIILTEAYHFNAWVQAGMPSSSSASEVVPNICPASGSLPFWCAQAVSSYTIDFVDNLKDEFISGGAPYSTDDYVLMINQGYLLATSIESYSEANGDNCGSTITSSSPCGVTVGGYNNAFTSIAYGPYGYGANGLGTWDTAPSSLFWDLLNLGGWNATNDGTLATDYLCTMVLGTNSVSVDSCMQGTNSTSANGGQGIFVGEKIITFNETFNVQFDFGTLPNICFLDGNITAGFVNLSDLGSNTPMPWCTQNSLAVGTLTSHQINCTAGGIEEFGGNAATTSLANGSEGSLADWYNGYCQCFTNSENTGGCDSFAQWTVSANNTDQFRWPALDLSDINCTQQAYTGMTADNALNPAGALTLCGDDFNDWFNALVPPPPSGS